MIGSRISGIRSYTSDNLAGNLYVGLCYFYGVCNNMFVGCLSCNFYWFFHMYISWSPCHFHVVCWMSLYLSVGTQISDVVAMCMFLSIPSAVDCLLRWRLVSSLLLKWLQCFCSFWWFSCRVRWFELVRFQLVLMWWFAGIVQGSAWCWGIHVSCLGSLGNLFKLRSFCWPWVPFTHHIGLYVTAFCLCIPCLPWLRFKVLIVLNA